MLSRSSIEVSAPSRLHFGLFSVGHETPRQFGGVGLMIESPRTRVRLSAAGELAVRGCESEAIQRHVISWFQRFQFLLPKYQNANQLPCKIELLSQPPRHSGFGSGTQLALSVAVGLLRFFDLPVPKPLEIAPLMGRGGRSAIGSHGFFYGGLLVDGGRTDQQPISPLDFQIPFPKEWPIVLATLERETQVSGVNEISAFSKLPSATKQQTDYLIELVNHRLVPSVTMNNYAEFGESVYTLSHQSGLFFQSVQGGPYNGRDIEQLVKVIRDFGIPAVGQSSWGPCVFAIAPDHQFANRLSEHISQQFGDRCETEIAFADNIGAQTSSV